MTTADDQILMDLVLHPDQRIDDLEAIRRYATCLGQDPTADLLAMISHDIAMGIQQLNVPGAMADQIAEVACQRKDIIRQLIHEGYASMDQAGTHALTTSVNATARGRAAMTDPKQ